MSDTIARFALVAALVPLLSCTVKYTYLKPGYAQNERQRFKRIHLYVGPVPARPKVRSLIGAVAREFVSVQTNYMLYPAVKPAPDTGPSVLCARKAGGKLPDGILELTVRKARLQDGAVRLGVAAVLRNCPLVPAKSAPRAGKVWEAYAESSYTSEDPDLKTVTASFTNRIGPSVRPYAGPAYLLVRTLLRELPNPTLTDGEKLEKIELME